MGRTVGRAPGRHSASERLQAPGPSRRLAGAGDCAPAAPTKTSPGKEDSTEERFETVGRRRSGVGAGAGLANARGFCARRGSAGGPTRGLGGERGWGCGQQEKHRGEDADDGVSGFCPRARGSLRITHAGVEEGGKGAGKGRSLRATVPGAAPGLRAASAGCGSRPGPAQGGGGLPAGGLVRLVQRGSLPRG